MKITETNVRKIFENDEPMKAVVSITIDDCFAVHDIKVIEGQNGIFVAMPSKQMNDGKFRDVAHPINQETRSMIKEAVLGAYRNALQEKEQ